jgi:GAF domain-containing protein
MTNLDITNILYCRLDNLTRATREQKRATTLKELGLLAPQDSLAILEEATQNSSSFLDIPIAFLSIFGDNQQQLIKSVVGLSSLGFNQELVVHRQIPPEDSFCIHVMDSLTPLAIEHTLQDPFFCQSLLTQHCGIRSYLGVPLITNTGECIGTLAVMDLQPRRFTTKDIQFLTILARLTITQLENNREKASPQSPQKSSLDSLNNSLDDISSKIKNIKAPVRLQLLAKLIEELRTPLTSVMGMTGILQQQIYGLLTPKQQEYLEVIRQSGQRMLVRIEEIIALDVDSSSPQYINLANVDMEMLCQQVINSLQGVIQDKKQEVHLSIQEGSRIWLVDRRAVQSMIYYLVAVMLETLPLGSQIKIQIDRQNSSQSIQVTSAQGNINLPSLKLRATDCFQFQFAEALEKPSVSHPQSPKITTLEEMQFSKSVNTNDSYGSEPAQVLGIESWHRLGLLLSHQIAEVHGGKMLMQDDAGLGYGYVVVLPQTVNSEQ